MSEGSVLGGLSLIGLAIALGIDAFAVAIGVGIALPEVTGRHVFRMAWHFGFFQFAMPILGWALGRAALDVIADYDHWVAFGLLMAIGGKMIYESFGKAKPSHPAGGDPTRGWSLVTLSVATSIDALAVGLSIALLKVAIIAPSIVIGLVAGLMTMIGIRLGRRIGALFGKRMEAVGGLVLMAIALRIIFTHLR